jgi:hypothetical protein
MDPEPRREAMQIVDIVGQEMGPFEPQPFPDRRVDIDAAPARNLARACAIRDIEPTRPGASRPLACPVAARPADETAKPDRWNLPRRWAPNWAWYGTFPDAFR